MSRVNPFGQTTRSVTLGRHILSNAGCHCTGCGDVVGVSVESAEASELVFDSFFGCAGCEFCGVGDDSGFGEGVGHVGGCGVGVFVEPCEVVAGGYEEGFGVFGVMRWR